MIENVNSSQKPEVVKLDLKDRKIIQELERNARQSNSGIAKKLKISKQATAYRINRMLRNGVIKNFMTCVNTQKLGYSCYNLYIQLGWISQEQEKQLEAFFEKEPNITWVATGVGGWNLAVAIQQKDMEHFNQIINQLREKFKTTINTFETMLILKEYKCHFIPKNITAS